MKSLLIFVLILSLTGCGYEDDVKQEIVTLKVIEVQKETTEWGCVGTDVMTILEVKEKGFRVEWCGKWGEKGDEFKGCFESGHGSMTRELNGVKRFCDGSYGEVKQ